MKILDKFPNCNVCREEGAIGDIVVLVPCVDSSDVITPQDLSIPIQAYIGRLNKKEGSEREIDLKVSLTICDGYTSQKQEYVVTELNGTMILKNPAWKLNQDGLKYLKDMGISL